MVLRLLRVWLKASYSFMQALPPSSRRTDWVFVGMGGRPFVGGDGPLFVCSYLRTKARPTKCRLCFNVFQMFMFRYELDRIGPSFFRNGVIHEDSRLRLRTENCLKSLRWKVLLPMYGDYCDNRANGFHVLKICKKVYCCL